MQNLDGVCALVSGSASEIGSEVIRELANRGASVLAADSTEERVQEALAALGLADADEIFAHALEGGDVVSWWDLANLIGSYFHTLHLFVHVADRVPGAAVRGLGVDALREAQTSTESFLTAMSRLEKYLIAATEESDLGACVVAVGSGPNHGLEDGILGSLGHASNVVLAEAMSRAYERDGSKIRVHAVRPQGDDVRGAAMAIVDLACGQLGRSGTPPRRQRPGGLESVSRRPDGRRRGDNKDTANEVVVRDLYMFPVKGCQGSRLEEAIISKSGFADDRLFSMLEPNGFPLDQIKAPQLGGLGVEWDPDENSLTFEHSEKGRFEHVRRESGETVLGSYVFDKFEVVDQGDEVSRWLTDTVGREVRLVSADKPWKVNIPHPDFVKLHETEKSRFYPVSPVSISNVASLDALNARLEAPIPMNRFRMNIVVEGLEAWEEERIAIIGSDSIELEGVTVAERCIIVTTDQETGERKKSDVLRELSKFHRRPKGERFGSGLAFGTYLVVAREGRIRVGDRLRVTLRSPVEE